MRMILVWVGYRGDGVWWTSRTVYPSLHCFGGRPFERVLIALKLLSVCTPLKIAVLLSIVVNNVSFMMQPFTWSMPTQSAKSFEGQSTG